MYRNGFLFLGLCFFLNFVVVSNVNDQEIAKKHINAKEIADQYSRAQAMLSEAVDQANRSNEDTIRFDELLQNAMRLYKEISKVVSEDQRVNFIATITDCALELESKKRSEGDNNLEIVIKLLRESASLGDEAAKYDLNLLLQSYALALGKGTGIPRDLVKAIDLIRESQRLELDKQDLIKKAEKDFFVSFLVDYAYALATGDGVAKDKEKAIEILRESASLENEFSQRVLSLFLDDKEADATYLLRQYTKLLAESEQINHEMYTQIKAKNKIK